jgi:hypothetical protein
MRRNRAEASLDSVRVQIYERLEKWELMEAVARSLVESDPRNPAWWASWAQATSQTKSLDAARAHFIKVSVFKG